MALNYSRSLVALVAILFVIAVMPASAGSLYVSSLGTDANATPMGNATSSGSWVELTSAAKSQYGGIIYNQVLNIDPTHAVSGYFDYYSGGGLGADGLSFFLLDATAAGWSAGGVTLGALGSSLGYAQRQENEPPRPWTSGVTGGYLGIGLDEYGLFAANTEGHDGYLDVARRPNWVSLRGCAQDADGNCTTAASTAGYSFLTGVNSGVDLDSAFLPGLFWRVSFTLVPQSSTELLISLGLQRRNDLNDNTRPVTPVYASQSINPGGALPEKIAIGWAASTGQVTNMHSVGSFGLEYTDPKVPEPGTYLLMAGGLLLLWRRRRAA